ncbi:hypothetical protein JTB14_012500 [Gonioctena quinquepunctata]|nr:hypothetical protein JTB14_012500 [Gonioctena quinquepunctata]
MLKGIVHSIRFYGALVWHAAMRVVGYHRKRLESGIGAATDATESSERLPDSIHKSHPNGNWESANRQARREEARSIQERRWTSGAQ